MTICKDYINLNFEWVNVLQREFTFAIPDNAYSSLQFGSTVRLKLIQSSISYIEFNNAVSIYIKGVSTRNFWSYEKNNNLGGFTLLGHMDNYIQNNQLDIYLSTLTSGTPEYTIHETPKTITIFFREDIGVDTNPEWNIYKDGSVLLEFSYENGIVDYQLAFNKKLNKL
jgi:hypothetical protein